MSDFHFSASMKKIKLPSPIVYAERVDKQETSFDLFGQKVISALVPLFGKWRVARLGSILTSADQYSEELSALSDADLQARTIQLRYDLRAALLSESLSAKAAGPAFALIREASTRTLGMRHFDVQMLGAWAMMRGMIAEMRTGEGKTLCATLAAATAALSGRPVHVITVNDYLAERDAEIMTPLYQFLGLSVGVILEGQDAQTRHGIYNCDIVYGSNNEIAFDYLRDRMAMRQKPGNLKRKVERLTPEKTSDPLRLRGLHFAVIDEADSVLIDEARTPLIISGQPSEEAGIDLKLFEKAMKIAVNFDEGKEFQIPRGEKRIELRVEGVEYLDEISEGDKDAFRIRVIREHAVMQALTALYLFHKDESYIVRDDKILIVDENTGRVMADRSWSEGLHQMVELKEGVEPTPQRETLSRITYQRIYRRYGRLAGMTGTGRDAEGEFWTVYGIAIAKIPSHKPDIRKWTNEVVTLTEKSKWCAIVDRVFALYQEGKPVLIGTKSVASSEEVSKYLTERDIPHSVLNASEDADEAAVIARAGEPGRVTVATNMAGRGVDIKLGDGALEKGGLHVILSERHDSRRVDRQLEGRCGRQGEPGRVEVFLSLEDELMRGRDAAFLRRTAVVLGKFLGMKPASWCIRMRQKQIEKSHAQMRRDLLEADRNLEDLLAVSGEME